MRGFKTPYDSYACFTQWAMIYLYAMLEDSLVAMGVISRDVRLFAFGCVSAL